MRSEPFYTWIGRAGVGVGLGAAILAGAGLAGSQWAASGSAALCAAAFFVPGAVFLTYGHRLHLRGIALRHVATFAGERGVVDMTSLAEEIHVPREVAERILRKAIAEDLVAGSFDARGRFVSSGAHQCPACGSPVPRGPETVACPECGRALEG